jgi:hypothetical protein
MLSLNWLMRNNRTSSSNETTRLLESQHAPVKQNYLQATIDFFTPYSLQLKSPAADEVQLAQMAEIQELRSQRQSNNPYNNSSSKTKTKKKRKHRPRQQTLKTPDFMSAELNWELLHFNKGLDYVNPRKDATEDELHAEIELKQILDSVRPLQGAELLIVISACIVALGACSTSKDFADHFIEGMEDATGTTIPIPYAVAKKMIEVVIALGNFGTQFSLTTKSFIHVVCRVRRAYSLPNHKFIRALSNTEMAILGGVFLTGFASAKMVFDSWGDTDFTLAVVLASLSFTSSTVVNLNFAYDRLLASRPIRNDLAIIRLLTVVKIDVVRLANDADNPHLFIEKLSKGTWLRQLNYRNTYYKTAKQQRESTIRQLIDLTETTADSELFDPREESLMTLENIVSASLGFIASTMNIKAGLQVLNFLTLGELPTIDFEQLLFDVGTMSTETLLTAINGLLLFGATSGAINTIINTRACYELINKVKKFYPTFMASGFETISRHDKFILGCIAIPAAFYAIGKAGSMLKYALIKKAIISRSMAFLTLPVFLGLAVMSMTGIAASARDRWEYPVLKKALDADSLLHHYNSLDYEDQMVLRRLLLNNFVLSIDAMYSTYNQSPADVTDKDFFSEELFELLEKKFGVDATGELDIDIEGTPEEAKQPTSPLSASLSPNNHGMWSPPRSQLPNITPERAARTDRIRIDNTGFNSISLLPPGRSPMLQPQSPNAFFNAPPPRLTRLHSQSDPRLNKHFVDPNPYDPLQEPDKRVRRKH